MLDPFTLTHPLCMPAPVACRCYMAIMTFFGLENKGGKKIPNKAGAFEVLRSFTDTEQVCSAKPAMRSAHPGLARAFMRDCRGTIALLCCAMPKLRVLLHLQQMPCSMRTLSLLSTLPILSCSNPWPASLQPKPLC